jgi:hypothetical protein
MNNVTPTRTAVLVVAAFVLGALGGRWARPRPAPSAGEVPYEVARRLCARGLCLRVVSDSAGGQGAGAYLTRTDQAWSELVCLPWSAAAAERWRGTVFCKELPSWMGLPERDPQRLRRYGGLFFYGDPDLLRQVAEVLRR